MKNNCHLNVTKEEFMNTLEKYNIDISNYRIDNNHIQYVGDSKINKFESPILNQGDLYEMYDYFSNEVESLIKNI